MDSMCSDRSHPRDDLKLSVQDFTIGWLCALSVEENAVIELLDVHLSDPTDRPWTKNGSLYKYGMIGGHRIVIRTLPTGSTDNATASAEINLMGVHFPNIQHFLATGIAGGLPGPIHPSNSSKNLHIGDVVIATPGNGHSGIINNSVHRHTVQGDKIIRMVNKTSATWRNASDFFVREYNRTPAVLSSLLERFPRPAGEDVLFCSNSEHISPEHWGCTQCTKKDIIKRPLRQDSIYPQIFQAVVVVGGLIQHGLKREEIEQAYPEARAVDMESSGFVEGFESLVVRGISSYADSHKSDEWQAWAAGRAAAVAKKILQTADIFVPHPQRHNLERRGNFERGRSQNTPQSKLPTAGPSGMIEGTSPKYKEEPRTVRDISYI